MVISLYSDTINNWLQRYRFSLFAPNFLSFIFHHITKCSILVPISYVFRNYYPLFLAKYRFLWKRKKRIQLMLYPLLVIYESSSSQSSSSNPNMAGSTKASRARRSFLVGRPVPLALSTNPLMRLISSSSYCLGSVTFL